MADILDESRLRKALFNFLYGGEHVIIRKIHDYLHICYTNSKSKQFYFCIDLDNKPDGEKVRQSELQELAKHIGSSYHTIAIQFLGYSDEEIEELQEDFPGNTGRVKFKILNGWVRRNPEGNPRYVST